MKVAVKLFAVARQRIGSNSIDVELPSSSTAGQLRTALAEQFPPLKDILLHSRIAVANEYATETTPITDASEIAIIPPVSGG